MSATDLQQIRTLLRTQPALVEPRSPMLGLKRMLRRREPAAAPVASQAPTWRAPASPAVEEPSTFTPAEPPVAAAQPRLSFGLAERVFEAVPEPVPEAAPAHDPAEPIVVPRRRSQDTGAIGPEEVIELRELLAERLPHLLTPDALSALAPPSADPLVDSPVTLPDAPLVEAAAAAQADPASRPIPAPAPDWSRRAICFTPARVERAGEQAVLSELYVRLIVEHEAVRASLAAAILAPEPARVAA